MRVNPLFPPTRTLRALAPTASLVASTLSCERTEDELVMMNKTTSTAQNVEPRHLTEHLMIWMNNDIDPMSQRNTTLLTQILIDLVKPRGTKPQYISVLSVATTRQLIRYRNGACERQNISRVKDTVFICLQRRMALDIDLVTNGRS